MVSSLFPHVVLSVRLNSNSQESKISAASIDDAIKTAIEMERSGQFKAINITGSNGVLLMDETQLRVKIDENQI